MNENTFRDLIEESYFGNTIEAYLEALLVILVVALALWIVQRVLITRLHKLAEKTQSKLDDYLIDLLRRFGFPVYFFIGFYIATRSLALATSIDRIVGISLVVFLTVKVIQVLQLLILFSVDRSYGRIKEKDPNRDTVLKNMGLLVKLVLWLAGGVFILDNMGIEVTGLLAGLGVGGLAIALASRAVLEDTFSSFSILMDRPFEVGDFMIVGDMMGVVEHIGFKTTRVRSLGGEELIFSNTDLTSSRIRNYKRMEKRRIAFTLGVVYQTSLEKMQQIPAMIEQIFKSIESTRFDRAHFKSFGAFSLDIEIVYYVLSRDYNKYMDTQQEINLKIYEAFEREGIEFAYPTQTLIVEGQQGDGGETGSK